MPTETKSCSICAGPIEPNKDADGRIYWRDGNNAEPVNSGRCCDYCDGHVVLIARLNLREQGKGW